MNKKT